MYLLYAHARIAAIGRKSGRDVAALAASGTRIVLGTEQEVALALAVARFPEAVEEMLSDLAPNRVTEYLYDLSGEERGQGPDVRIRVEQQPPGGKLAAAW